jgi:phosphate transport system permease protein
MALTLRRNKKTNDVGSIDEKIRIKSVESIDVTVLIGSAISAFALVQLLYETFLPLSGALGFIVVWYVFFLAISWTAVRELRGNVRAKDHLARVLVWSGASLAIVPLVLIVLYVIGKGYHALRPQFFTEDQRYVGALSDSTEGGGAHAIIGTIQQVGIASLIAVPLGITTASSMP